VKDGSGVQKLEDNCDTVQFDRYQKPSEVDGSFFFQNVWCVSTKLYGISSQKNILIVTTLRTSNLTEIFYSYIFYFSLLL
jgi:hypothetical protein